MFQDSFPIELKDDVKYVSSNISNKTYSNVGIGASAVQSSWILLDNQEITFPYRIYYIDNIDKLNKKFTPEQMVVYHCIFSRSCDGYVREKHIKALLSCDLPAWAIPYIIKVSDEYVIEILESIYQSLKNINTDDFKAICHKNLQSFLYGHDRMISYWNEFYRTQCYKYHNYVGYQLYKECYGYNRSLEKLRIIQK